MDRTRFTDNSPGRIVRIDLSSRKDWAFIPNPMPPDWKFDPVLWPLLVDAKESLGTLNGIGRTLPNPLLLLRPLQRAEALASSRIEGTYVTAEQLLLYELDTREPRVVDERTADWREVFNYDRALKHGCELLKTLPVCNRLVREMHQILLGGVRGRDKAPGDFRKLQVQIGSNGRFIPPPSGEVQRLMDDLERYVNAEDGRYDPLIRCYLVHYQFETIHPFEDGNGRVGRSLLALMIYKWLGHEMPWLYMSAFFDQFKDEYVENLFSISAEGNWTRWLEFCLRGTIAQATDSIRRCNRLSCLRTEFHKRVTSPSSRSHKIIEELFTSPIVTVASLAKDLGITYPTAKADVEKLVRVGILSELPGAYPRSFYSSEIMRIAYRNEQEDADVPDERPNPQPTDVANVLPQPS